MLSFYTPPPCNCYQFYVAFDFFRVKLRLHPLKTRYLGAMIVTLSYWTDTNYERKEGVFMNKEKTSSTLLTEGTIWKKILAFAFPLFLGNLFQQLYNTADSLIVGNFISSDALAAVSSSGSLIFLLVGFFNGISVGAGVVIARYYGARETDKVERAVHTTVAFGIVAGILLMLVGILFTPTILKWMGTPADVLPASITYFRIYFCGSLAFVLYNIFVGILQSVGDSKHPLYYLILSSVVNIVLDLLFVAVLGFGVGAAALATVISQFISAVLCLIRLLRSDAEYKIRLRSVRFDRYMLGQIIRNGLPAGVQNSIIAFANVIVQSNINSFGKMAVAGCGAYSKIEGFGFLPINCFAMALTTFISQNLGARQYDRAKKGARFGILCSISLAELIGIAIYIFSPYLIATFNSDTEVVKFGVTQAHTVTLFYCLLAYSHCLAAIFRGAGRSTVPMVVMMVCWCIIRVTYITVILRFVPVITAIFWAYPLTWSLSTIIFTIYYFKSDWIHTFERQK